MCRMIECDHKTRHSASASHHIGQSWYEHGICACCAIELVSMNVIEGKGYRFSQMCYNRNHETKL